MHFFPIRDACPDHVMFLDFVTLTIMREGTSYEALHYALFIALL
jgi:hypothetical protein